MSIKEEDREKYPAMTNMEDIKRTLLVELQESKNKTIKDSLKKVLMMVN